MLGRALNHQVAALGGGVLLKGETRVSSPPGLTALSRRQCRLRRGAGDSFLAAGGLLSAVARTQRVELLAGGSVQAGKTPMPYQTGEKTGRDHRAFIWKFGGFGGIVVRTVWLSSRQ